MTTNAFVWKAAKEIPFEKYIKLDNTELSPAEAAARIQDFFHL